MPPRIRCPSVGPSIRQQTQLATRSRTQLPPALGVIATGRSELAVPASRSYATAAPLSAAGHAQLPADYVHPAQPPSAKRPDYRKSQLLRAYTSLLRSTPIALVFQHNNLTAEEWIAIRRELKAALEKVPVPPTPEGAAPFDAGRHIQIQVMRTRILAQALKIVEFFDPAALKNPAPETAAEVVLKGAYTHDLSQAAYDAVSAVDLESLPADSAYTALAPLLVGPVALLTFPVASPAHMAAALSTLSPSPPAFPAPSRKKNPGYYDPTVQGALQKLMLVGGRVEDRVLDLDGLKWVGGIEGGREGLRAQLVHVLQGAGLGLASTLEGAGKSVWLTLEGRRGMLEDEAKGPEEQKKEGEEAQS